MRKNIVLKSIFKVNRAIKSMTICCLLCITSYVSAFTRDYLCFTAEEVDASVALKKYGKPAYKMSLMYSLDGARWKNYSMGKEIPLSNVGDKVYFKAKNFKCLTNDFAPSNGLNLYHFVFPKKVSASGNVMSLIDSTCQRTDVPKWAFYGLFLGCTSLDEAPQIPAKVLSKECYFGMFFGCTSLQKAPKLPATALARNCYSAMFYGCTSLTKAPDLPANALSYNCYGHMFKGCTSLQKAPDLPATTLASDCYNSMFEGCTSLTKAPDLPATSLEDGCYRGMFKNCTNLNSISVAFSEWDSSQTSIWFHTTRDWLCSVSPSGTFICPDSLSEEFGNSYIPTGWTVQRKPNSPTSPSAKKRKSATPSQLNAENSNKSKNEKITRKRLKSIRIR